jgi:hypothetical protein
MPFTVRGVHEGVIFAEWGVVARVASCPDKSLSTGGPSVPDGVVSLKFEQTETYDENWTTTLRTSGLLITRTDVAKSADSYRGLCIPPAPNNFVRVSQEVALNETGTKLKFSYTDREKYVGPPQPATKAGGQFSVSNVAGGGKRIGQVTVRLEGPPGVARYDLMVRAVQIAASKLESARPVIEKGQALYTANYTEWLYENVVEVSLQAMLAPVKLSERTAISRQVFGVTPLGSANMPGVSPPVRRRIAQLIAAPFMDPCGTSNSPPTDTGGDGIQSLIDDGQRSQVRVLTETAFEDHALTSGGADDEVAGYDWYETTASWQYDTGRVQLPAPGVGDKPGVSKVVIVHGGVMTMTLFWTARRRGRAPVSPAFVSQDPNLVGLYGNIDPEGTDFNGDAVNPVYTISGTYVYAVLDPAAASVFAPVLPYTERTLTADFAELPAKYVSKQMTGSAKGTEGAMPFLGSGAATAAGVVTDTPGTSSSGDAGTRVGVTPQDAPTSAIPDSREAANGIPSPDSSRPFDLPSGLGGNNGGLGNEDAILGQLPNVGPPVYP